MGKVFSVTVIVLGVAIFLLAVSGIQAAQVVRPNAHCLPPLPSTMASALGSVPVTLVDSFPGDSDGVVAHVLFVRRHVDVLRALSPVGQWEAYYHEQVHLTLYDATASIGGDEEERVADAVANQRVREMLATLPASCFAP